MNRPARIRLRLLAVVIGAALGWMVAAWVTRPLIRAEAPRPIGPRKPPSLGVGPASRLEHQMDVVWNAGSPSAQIAAAVALAGTVDPADFARFLENLDRLPPPAARRLASHALMRRWVSHDPEAALQWCADDHANDDWVSLVAVEWAKQAPAQIDPIIESLPVRDRTSTVFAIAEVLATQGNRDDALALFWHPEWTGRGIAEREFNNDLRLDFLAEGDPNWLAERIDSLPDDLQFPAQRAVARTLAQSDVRAAFEWAAAQPHREQLLAEVVTGARTPSDWLAGLAALPVEIQREVKVASWFDHFAPDEVVEALTSHASQLPDTLRRSLMRYLEAKLNRSSDPAALANRVLAVDDLSPHFSVASFVSHWVGDAPAAARAWSESLQNESLRAAALEALSEEADAVEAQRHYAQLTLAERVVKDAADNQIGSANRLLAVDPSTRRAMLQADHARPDSEGGQDPFRTNVMEEMAERYPSETAEWLSDKLAGDATPTLAETACVAASWWAAEAPREAAAWVASLPPGDARAWAAANVAFQWRLVDPAAARAWLDSLPAADRAVAQRALESAPGRPPE
ncbi:MAG: hypothetical protein ACKV19_05105 [Verrucomicrobiales bacterium]